MDKTLNVKYVNDASGLQDIEDLYKKEEINRTFGGFRMDRLMCSCYNFLITLDKENIGFILLVKEKQNKEVVFLDIAILEKYRHKGYGQQALTIFKEKYVYQIKDAIIAETQKKNISINKIMNNSGFELIESKNEDINRFKIKSLTLN